MRTPDVRSTGLTHTLKTVAPKIKQFTATLDQISQDIKALERWLTDCGVRVEVEVDFPEDPPIESAEGFPPKGPQPIPVRITFRKIAWAPTPDGKSWRIQLREYSQEGDFGEDYGNSWEQPQLAQCRPLIETPVAVRIKCIPGLSTLLERIAAQIPEIETSALAQVLAAARPGGGIVLRTGGTSMIESTQIRKLAEEVGELEGLADELTAGLEAIRKKLDQLFNGVRANEEDAMAHDAIVDQMKDERWAPE